RRRRWRGGRFRNLYAAAAVDVVQPDFVSAEAFGISRNDDVLAIGSPCGRDEVAARILAEFLRLASVHVRDPEVIGSVAIAGEGDQLAVGREFRLPIERETRSNRFCLTAFDRYGVEIAQQVE